MADRVSASIRIGGALIPAAFAELASIIADEGLSTEWDGKTFAPEDRSVGEPLHLYAHEVAWGRFEALETWCVEQKLPFARWSGGYGGQWGPERVVFTGRGEPTSYAADEDDQIVIVRDTIERLGSVEVILAYFDAADVPVPPLVVEGDPAADIADASQGAAA